MRLKISIISSLLGVVSFFFVATPVFAHVIVYPHQVGIAATQDFTVSVPNEKNIPVISVRLLIPEGVTDISPNATPGWNITIKSKGKGDNAVISEIDWANGSIQVGEREEFIFQAQVPPTPTILGWKAYQTYSDDTVVSWDVDPAKMQNLSDQQQDQLADKENKGEYSTTQVVNDLAASNDVTNAISSANQSGQIAIIISTIAIISAAGAFYLSIKKRK